MSDEKKPTSPAAPVAHSNTALADAVKYVSEQMLPSIIAASVAAANKGVAPAPRGPAANAPRAKCHECQQELSGCEGKHTMMVVYPTKYPQHADYFLGVMINGVQYLSNDESHRVLVPANCESTIQGIVATFEQNEQDMLVGRKAIRQSGRVTPHGSSVSPATQAWR